MVSMYEASAHAYRLLVYMAGLAAHLHSPASPFHFLHGLKHQVGKAGLA